ncbi:MAG: DUF503 domain-containing protein [Candidatus Eisenbacteria bacterium]
MFYAVGRLEILIPQSQSLKEKRSILNRLKDRLSHRFHCSIAEVDHQDLWQRAALGVALVVSGPEEGGNALAAIRREIEQDMRVVVVDVHRRIDRLEGGTLGIGDEWSGGGDGR